MSVNTVPTGGPEAGGALAWDHTTQQTGVVIVVEDHYPEGGIGDAVAHELVGTATVFAHLAVRTLPASDDTAKALDQAGISAPHIAEAVRTVLDSGR